MVSQCSGCKVQAFRGLNQPPVVGKCCLRSNVDRIPGKKAPGIGDGRCLQRQLSLGDDRALGIVKKPLALNICPAVAGNRTITIIQAIGSDDGKKTGAGMLELTTAIQQRLALQGYCIAVGSYGAAGIVNGVGGNQVGGAGAGLGNMAVMVIDGIGRNRHSASHNPAFIAGCVRSVLDIAGGLHG
nr:hypothetical protein SPACI_40940 [Sporomusa acidovorans DSM 3132]